jgi:hypothetical protein
MVADPGDFSGSAEAKYYLQNLEARFLQLALVASTIYACCILAPLGMQFVEALLTYLDRKLEPWLS